MKIVQANSLRSTRASGVENLVSQQILDEIGIRRRIAYPFFFQENGGRAPRPAGVNVSSRSGGAPLA
jgi:hypothetical protein